MYVAKSVRAQLPLNSDSDAKTWELLPEGNAFLKSLQLPALLR